MSAKAIKRTLTDKNLRECELHPKPRPGNPKTLYCEILKPPSDDPKAHPEAQADAFLKGTSLKQIELDSAYYDRAQHPNLDPWEDLKVRSPT